MLLFWHDDGHVARQIRSRQRLCVDERGVGEVIAGVTRGSPVDSWKAAEAADNTLVIPTQ